MRQRDLGELVAVLVRAGQIHPSPFGVQLLPLISVRPLTAVSRNDKQRVLLFDQIQAFGLLGDIQLGEQGEANVVIRIRKFLIVFLGTHVQIQLVQTAARGQRLERNIHGVAVVILHGVSEGVAEQGLPVVGGCEGGHHARSRFGVAASVQNADPHIGFAFPVKELGAQHQVVGVGIHNLVRILRSQAHQHRIVVRRVCGQDQGVGERAAVFRQQRAELLRAHRLNDFRRQSDIAVPIGGNQQLGLIALGIARHQQGGAHVALGGYAVAVGAGDVPAVAVQRVIHAVHPADGVHALLLRRKVSVGGEEQIGALLRLGAVDMQGLNDLAALLHLHVQPRERQVARIAHGKNQVDVIPGAHAGVVGHGGLQFSRHHQPIGEIGQGLAQVGAVFVAQIHRVEARARIL